MVSLENNLLQSDKTLGLASKRPISREHRRPGMGTQTTDYALAKINWAQKLSWCSKTQGAKKKREQNVTTEKT